LIFSWTLADFFPDGGVFEALQELGRAPRVKPGRDDGVEHGTPGEVGVLIEGHIQAFAPGLIDQSKSLAGSSPIFLPGDFQVGNVKRAAGINTDPDDLADGIKKEVSFVTHMDNEKPP